MKVHPPPATFRPESSPPHTELLVIDPVLAGWAKGVLTDLGTRASDAGREAVREELITFLRALAGRANLRIYRGKWAYYLQMIEQFDPGP